MTRLGAWRLACLRVATSAALLTVALVATFSLAAQQKTPPPVLPPPATATTPKGSKINFSEQPVTINSPLRQRDDEALNPQFEFLNRKSSFGGVVEFPSGASPSSTLSLPNTKKLQRLIEKMDEDRNWAYKDPKDFGKDSSLNAVLEDDEESKTGFRRGPRTAAEKYIEGFDKESANSSATNRAPDRATRDENDTTPRLTPGQVGELRTGEATRTELQLTPRLEDDRKSPFLQSTPAEFMNALNGNSPLGANLGVMSPSLSLRAREQRQTRLDEFKKLLGPPAGSGLGGSGASLSGASEASGLGAPTGLGQQPGTALILSGPKGDVVGSSPYLDRTSPISGPPGLPGFSGPPSSVGGPGLGSRQSPFDLGPRPSPNTPTPFATPFPQRKF